MKHQSFFQQNILYISIHSVVVTQLMTHNIICRNEIGLILLSLQTNTDTLANSVDRYEPSHLDLHCLPFYH